MFVKIPKFYKKVLNHSEAEFSYPLPLLFVVKYIALFENTASNNGPEKHG